MDPSIGLQAASGLVSFLLKTTLEWGICLILVRIAGSPRARFNLWLAMSLAFAAQWIEVGTRIWRSAQPHSNAGLQVPSPAERIGVAAPVAGVVAHAVELLLCVYAGVLVGRVVAALGARVRLRRAMRFRTAPSFRVQSIFDDAAERAGVRGCALWVLPGLTSPATLGWFRPMVILPATCEMQDEAELSPVFWHELKHVQRRDALWNAVISGCRDLLWFHPAVGQAAEAARAERELACDAAVVRDHPQSRDLYASCLLRFARLTGRAAAHAIPIEIASGAELLKRRVGSILSEKPRASRLEKGLRTLANAALIALLMATVPALNILFAAQMRAIPADIPLLNVSASDVLVRASHRLQAVPETRRIATESATEGAVIQPAAKLPVIHDEALAAEHRAALGVITESTGMETPAPRDAGLNGAQAGQLGRQQTSASPSGWAGVVQDTAARLGPLMTDHDGDRH